jgi:prepilin-type N-terminal cleavage/methylation domain-containing protein
MATRIRSAFTLVELLAVMAIIGFLMTLLFPFIKGAIESARATKCMNYQRDIGSALKMYENSKQNFPGYVETLVDHPVGWPSLITQYLQTELWPTWRMSWNGGVPGAAVFPAAAIGLFRCPSDTATNEGWPLTYVVNCGQPDVYSQGGGVSPDWPGNGVFHNHDVSTTSALSTAQLVYVSTQSISDGVQYTLMLSENVQAGEWADPYRPSTEPDAFGVKTTPNSLNLYAQGKPLEATLGMVWFPTNNPPVCCTINGHVQEAGVDAVMHPPTSTICSGDGPPSGASYDHAYTYARPSSFHPGYVVATFCDGHSIRLRESITYAVYAALMTPSGQQSYIAGDTNNPPSPSGAPIDNSVTPPMSYASPVGDKDFLGPK